MCTPRNLKLLTVSIPVDVGGGVLSLLSPLVHDQILHFVDADGEMIFLAILCQDSHLLPVGCLIVVANQATQSWRNRE